LLDQAVRGTAIAVDVVAVIALEVDQQAVSADLTANSLGYRISGNVVAEDAGTVDHFVVLPAAKGLVDVAGQRASEKIRTVLAAFDRIDIRSGGAGKHRAG
jgi:hypothetical protein